MRKTRELKANAKYHVTAKVNRGEFILKDSKFKELFLEVVKRAKKKYEFQIENFCVMDNHIHFIIHPEEKENLSRIMQWILSVFARYYNKIMKLKGHVWYDRFKSKIISDIKQLIAVFNYIKENPVKAELVKEASEFEYSGISFIKKGDFSIIDPPADYLVNLV